jgi:hypothetical protein
VWLGVLFEGVCGTWLRGLVIWVWVVWMVSFRGFGLGFGLLGIGIRLL